MSHPHYDSQVVEACAVLACVALFEVCYGCFWIPRSGHGRLAAMTGLAASSLFMVAACILTIMFGLAQGGQLPEAIAAPSFLAWKGCVIMAVNTLEVSSHFEVKTDIDKVCLVLRGSMWPYQKLFGKPKN